MDLLFTFEAPEALLFRKVNGDFFIFIIFMYDIQHCFICHLSDSKVSPVSTDAGIEPRTVVSTAWAVRRSNRSARSHPQLG